jgi:hypothetical protein
MKNKESRMVPPSSPPGGDVGGNAILYSLFCILGSNVQALKAQPWGLNKDEEA